MSLVWTCPPGQSPPPPQGAQPTGPSHFLITPLTLQTQPRGHLLQEAFLDNPTLRLEEEPQGIDGIYCTHLSVWHHPPQTVSTQGRRPDTDKAGAGQRWRIRCVGVFPAKCTPKDPDWRHLLRLQDQRTFHKYGASTFPGLHAVVALLPKWHKCQGLALVGQVCHLESLISNLVLACSLV